MAFLMQLYAPVDELPDAYHRVFYVFYCANLRCQRSKKEIRVIRAQCSEAQELYKNEAPPKTQPEKKKEAAEDKKEEPKKKLDIPAIAEENAASKGVEAEGKAEKKKPKKKKKKKNDRGGKAHVIEVVSEKTEVTEFYVARTQQLLSGKKLPDISEEEKTTVPISKEEDKHLKELIRQYEETQEELSVEDKKSFDVVLGCRL